MCLESHLDCTNEPSQQKGVKVFQEDEFLPPFLCLQRDLSLPCKRKEPWLQSPAAVTREAVLFPMASFLSIVAAANLCFFPREECLVPVLPPALSTLQWEASPKSSRAALRISVAQREKQAISKQLLIYKHLPSSGD